MDDVDKLSVIHVSGTKGKGSTCAFSERILHSRGYKTGLFTSPHMIEVRERIQINGRPISQDLFSKHFWRVYDSLESTQTEVCSLNFTVYCFCNVYVDMGLCGSIMVCVLVVSQFKSPVDLLLVTSRLSG